MTETICWHQTFTVCSSWGPKSLPWKPAYVIKDMRSWQCFEVWGRRQGQTTTKILADEESNAQEPLGSWEYTGLNINWGPQSFDRDDRASPTLAGALSSHPIKPQACIRKPQLQIWLSALPFLWHESVSSFTSLLSRQTIRYSTWYSVIIQFFNTVILAI